MSTLSASILRKESAAPARPGLPARLRRRASRALRAALALGTLAAGGYAIVAERGYVVSDAAVVTAYHVALRAPIEGQLRGRRGDVGDRLPGGSVLAQISNDRVDDWRLAELRGQRARVAAEHAAAEAERETLLATREALLARAAAHARAVRARLHDEAAAAAAQLQERVAQRDQLREDAERRTALSAAGAFAAAEAARARSQLLAAEHAVTAARQHAALMQRRAEDAGRGIFTDAGANDVAYSSQRADDLAIRLAAIGRDLRGLAAQDAALAEQLAAESTRVARQRDAALTLASDAMLWRVGSGEGERVAVGDTIADYIRCDAAFLIVHVPQPRLPDVAVGGIARFRLTGETAERSGRVVTVSGPAELAEQRRLAALLPPAAQPVGAVRVAFPSGTGECLVGRRARVLLPTGLDDAPPWRDRVASLLGAAAPARLAGTP